MDKETAERIERPIPFQEFPKMLYHPDGSTTTVDSEAAQAALGGEWAPSPAEAAADRAKRDAALKAKK